MVTTVERQEKQSPGDAELLQAYVERGEQSAFQQLYDRYSRLIYGVCLRRLGGAHDMAKEAMQMTFLALAKRSGSLKERETLQPWLIKTCCFCSKAVQRQDFRYRHHLGTYNDQDEVAQSRQSAGDEEWTEACKVVDEEVLALPPRLSDLVVRHYFRGQSFESIAEEVGLAAATLRVMAARAREKIRKRMMRRGIVLSAAALVAGLQSAADACASLVPPRVDAGAGGSGAGVDAVLQEMDRAANVAAWGKIGAVAAGLATIGVGTVLLVSHFQAQPTAETPPIQGMSWRIESVIGAPIVRRVETMQTLTVGDVLCAGDRIVTGSNQEVQVVSDGEDRILVREEGEVRFEHPTLNTEHRTSKLGKGDSQVRVVCGAIVAELKSPVHFATPHAEMNSGRADFFLMVASGVTTNATPWSFTRLDVTEGSAKFFPSSIFNLKSEIPLVGRQVVCAGTDHEGKTIETVARASDGLEFSPKYSGVFFLSSINIYARGGSVLHASSLREGRVLAVLDEPTFRLAAKDSPAVTVRSEGGKVVLSNSGPETSTIFLPMPSWEGDPFVLRSIVGTSRGCKVDTSANVCDGRAIGLPPMAIRSTHPVLGAMGQFDITFVHVGRLVDGTHLCECIAWSESGRLERNIVSLKRQKMKFVIVPGGRIVVDDLRVIGLVEPSGGQGERPPKGAEPADAG